MLCIPLGHAGNLGSAMCSGLFWLLCVYSLGENNSTHILFVFFFFDFSFCACIPLVRIAGQLCKKSVVNIRKAHM